MNTHEEVTYFPPIEIYLNNVRKNYKRKKNQVRAWKKHFTALKLKVEKARLDSFKHATEFNLRLDQKMKLQEIFDDALNMTDPTVSDDDDNEPKATFSLIEDVD